MKKWRHQGNISDWRKQLSNPSVLSQYLTHWLIWAVNPRVLSVHQLLNKSLNNVVDCGCTCTCTYIQPLIFFTISTRWHTCSGTSALHVHVHCKCMYKCVHYTMYTRKAIWKATAYYDRISALFVHVLPFIIKRELSTTQGRQDEYLGVDWAPHFHHGCPTLGQHLVSGRLIRRCRSRY